MPTREIGVIAHLHCVIDATNEDIPLFRNKPSLFCIRSARKTVVRKGSLAILNSV